MKHILKSAAFIISASLLLASVFLFRTEPAVRIWDNYKVVYFPVETELQQIIDVFPDELKDLIIYENQDYRHSWSNPMYLQDSGISISRFSQKEMRDFFFYDRDRQCRLIYAPENVYVDVLNILKHGGLTYGTDSVSYYPWLYPSVCLAVILLITAFCRIPVPHALCGVPFVLFCLWCPFYSTVSSSVCIIFSLMICEQYAGRKHGVIQVIMNPVFVSSLVLSGVSVFLGGGRLALLSMATAACSIFLFLSISFMKKKSVESCHFQYVPMLTARNEKPYKRLKLVPVIVPAVVSIVLIVFFFMSAGIIKTSDTEGLYLPSPSEYTSTEGINTEAYSELKAMNREGFPDLADFTDEYWLNERYAYSRISDKFTEDDIKPGITVSYPFYSESADGIHSAVKVIDSFDDAFMERLVSEFTDNGGAEKFLATQGNMFTTKYTKAGDTSHDINSILSIISVFILFLALLIIKLIKGKANE